MTAQMDEKKNSSEIFEKMPVPKALMTMAVPTIIGQLIVLIYNLADTFFVGRTNNPYMIAGVSLILPIFNITISLAGLAGVGGGSLVSRLLGAGNSDEAKTVSRFSLYIAVLVSALFSILTFLFMEPLLGVLGAGPETYPYARIYAFCVIVLGAVPTVLSNTMSTLLRSVGSSRQAGFGITMGGLLNIGLDPLFMFVLFPRGMEIAGAGVATFLSNCISCLYFFTVIYRSRATSVITFSPRLPLPQRESIRGIFGVGIPASVATLLFDLDYVIIDRLMSGYGDIALASVGIVLKAERLPLNVGIGICQGMMPIVAYNYAARNFKRMKSTMRCALLSGIITAAASVTMYELLAGHIMRLFIADAETVALGTDFLRVRCLATPLMFLSFFTVYLFQALGRGDRAMFLGVMRWAVFNIPMLFLLNHLVGMYGIVWSQVTADVLTVTLSCLVYRQFARREHI